jgi:phosphoadenosine phosphosulfate reductase
MKIESNTTPISWYRRPRPTQAPDGFATRLAESIDLLREASSHEPCVLAHSLSAEDMILFHLIAEHDLPITSIALDTGKLPSSIIELWRRAEAIYSRRIEAVFPTAKALKSLSHLQAESAIYESKDARAKCCEVRKTAPLRAALAGKRAWVVGLRRAQSVGRADVSAREFDSSFQLEKFSPLFLWGDDDIWYFIDKYSIPYNAHYEKGYASIGCDPCTRPIREGEHPRAGRWWWEQTDPNAIKSECGIHVAAASDANPTSSNARTA